MCDTLIRVPKSKGIDGCLLDPRGKCRVCVRYRYVWIRVIFPFLLWLSCLILLLINNTNNGVANPKKYQNCVNYKGAKKNDISCRCGFVDCQKKDMYCAAPSSMCCLEKNKKQCQNAFKNNKGPSTTYPWSVNCINNKGKSPKDCDTPIAPAPSSSIAPQIMKNAPSEYLHCSCIFDAVLLRLFFFNYHVFFANIFKSF